MSRQLAFEFRPGSAPVAPREPEKPEARRVLLTPPRRSASPAPTLSPRLALQARIAAALRVPVHLVLTNNRRTMISSSRRRSGRIDLRLHQMFLSAPERTMEDLLCYLADGDPRARAAIRAYVRDHSPKVERPPRRVLLRTKGAVYDLAAMLEEVVEEYIPEGAEGVHITWGRRPSTRRRRQSIRLGTYTHDQKLIRIHPALDQASVPRFFVAFVVFHEMLHHVVPGRPSGDRVLYHPPEFRARERTHPDFERATRWETKNLDLLLSYGTARPRAKR